MNKTTFKVCLAGIALFWGAMIVAGMLAPVATSQTVTDVQPSLDSNATYEQYYEALRRDGMSKEKAAAAAGARGHAMAVEYFNSPETPKALCALIRKNDSQRQCPTSEDIRATAKRNGFGE